MRISLLLLICLLACGLPACNRVKVSPEEEKVLLDTVRENVAAMEKEEIDAFIGTIHSESPQFNDTYDVAQGLFEKFQLKYTLSDLKVVGRDKGSARVSFTQRTEKVGGDAPFKNNTVSGVYELKQEDGRWKIFGTVSSKVVQIDP